jgi:NADH-quinone oxidoreductase subunit F
VDLHFTGATASGDERAAVDSVLDLPETGSAGQKARGRRHLLLPALQAIQNRVGWISNGALNYACERLVVPPADAYGVATFYGLLSTTPRPRRVLHVCDDIGCVPAGAERIARSLDDAWGPEGVGADGDRAMWVRSPCLGLCDRAPAALLTVAGDPPQATQFAPLTPQGAVAILDDVPWPAAGAPQQSRAGGGPLRLLSRVGVADPERLDAYRAHGGYAALPRALHAGPQAVVAEVVASKLFGRGGAAFPTGRKMQAVAQAPQLPHYVVCNADESEPGTFKDRVLMECDPFAVVEAITIAAFAAGCSHGFVYLRGEYPLAAQRLENAFSAARAAGFLGNDVCGSGFSFDVEIRRGAGAYICGEETALFNSIEGKRGEPRSKPPFPVQSGLFGKPTLVNNVETLVNLLPIVLGGGEAYAATGTADSSGTRLFCVSGAVRAPGLYEFEHGTTLRTLLEAAGGPAEPDIAGMLLGGAAGTFVGTDRLDMPLSFEAARECGATLGSGVVMVFDRNADLPAVLRRIARFFREESCGQCVPCRVGTVRQEEALERLTSCSGASRAKELSLLTEIAGVMRDASICGLGQTAANAIESARATLGLLSPTGRP